MVAPQNISKTIKFQLLEIIENCSEKYKIHHWHKQAMKIHICIQLVTLAEVTALENEEHFKMFVKKIKLTS